VARYDAAENMLDVQLAMAARLIKQLQTRDFDSEIMSVLTA
jgi:hypothetical protein